MSILSPQPVDVTDYRHNGAFKLRKIADRWIAIAAFQRPPRKLTTSIFVADFEFRVDAQAWLDRWKTRG